MPLNVSVTAEDLRKELEIDDLTLMFFDTLMASLNAAFPSCRVPFEFFEYSDEDGDKVAVRSDDELQTFLVEVLRCSGEAKPLLQIRLMSTRSRALLLSQQQMSIDDEDGVLASFCGGAEECFSSSPSSSNTLNLPKREEREGQDAWKNRGEDLERKEMQKQRRDSIGGNSNIFGPEDLRLIERLSDGQFGTVYKALDVKNDRLLAIKCVAVDGENGTRQGLLSEIAILKKCTHPNIVTFHAALFVDNQLLICMELMDSLSLDRYGKLPPQVLGAVTIAIVDGLAHLWSNSIMHRDIKPSNFLVNSDGEVKLADFGVSKQMAQSIAWSYVGTKVYMAPERIGGELYNVASDVWSLGVSLAEMAMGRFPFDFATSATISTKSAESLVFGSEMISTVLKEPDLQAIGDGFADELLAGCLMPRPKQRLETAEILSSRFLRAHRPINQKLVALFILERRK